MPLPSPRVVRLVVAAVLLAALVALPGTSIAARPTHAAETWVVTLRSAGSGALPSRRGGLRPAAAAIARTRAAVTTRTIEGLQAEVGFRANQRYTYAVSGFAASLTPFQVARLRADRRVVSLHRVIPMALAGQIVPAGIARVDATPGNTPADVSNVSVAIVDTGVGHYEGGAWRHAGELNVVGGVNAFADNGVDCALRAPDPTKNPGSYDDTNSHGTHVAGTIGAANNGIGAVGIAPGVKLYSVRVFDGVSGTDATVICGLDWIAAWNTNHPDEASDIDVVNMSLRGQAPRTAPTGCVPGNPDPEEVAVCAVIDSGASVVAAAGNETDAVANYIPSRYAEVITVGAMSDFDGVPGGLAQETCVPPRGTEIDDTFSLYSNFGPEVDIVAPGTCVKSTALDSAGGTMIMSGTSMATPHVTGAIARYLGLHPGTPPEEMARLLTVTATVDWDAATAPAGTSERLLDVGALTAPAQSQDLAVWSVPQVVPIPAGTPEATVKVRLQRIGDYAGVVTLSVPGPYPSGVIDAAFADPTVPGDQLGRTLTLTLDSQPTDGDRTLTIHAQGESAGPSSTVDVTLRFDATPPQIGDPWPRIVFRNGSYATTAPSRLSWSAADGEGPLERQELQRQRSGGGWSMYSRPGRASGAADASMERWTPTSWRIKAVDRVGNATTSDPLATRLVPIQSGKADLGAGWRTVTRSSASADDLVVTTQSRATAVVGFTGRAVAVVAPTGPDKGRFRVRIDGAIAGTIDLSGAFAMSRRVVFASSALTPGPHTVKIISLGGTVELDAFLVLK